MKPCSSQTELLTHCLDLLPAGQGNCVLAYSGGLDSCVLLHLLANSSLKPTLKLWHVNHGLQLEAGNMAKFCQKQASAYNLELTISHLNLKSTQSNIESIARKARYALFAKGLTRNDFLLTAHHLDDQVETFLLNVLRGSGSAGLRGIAAQRSIAKSQLIRPMLHFKRETLIDYAKQYKLEWFEDPSNRSLQFNRNYIRHKVTPIIQERWPNYQYSIATVCEIQSETQQLLDDLAALDYETVSVSNNNLALGKLSPALNTNTLRSLSLARQKNVLRYWLRINQRASLPKSRLDSFIQQLGAKQGANPMVQNCDYDIRIYDGRIFIVDQEITEPKLEAYDFLKHLELKIPELNLVLRRNSVLGYLGLDDSGQVIQIRFRNKQLSTNQNSHRLKRLFQTLKIAPWLRNTTPQLCIDGELRGLWVV